MLLKIKFLLFFLLSVFTCLPAASMEAEMVIPKHIAKRYPTIKEIDNYSINLMWIGRENDESLKYIMGGRKGASSEADFDICSKGDEQGMEGLLKQANKWHTANPKAIINFWYSATCTNDNAVNNTYKLLEKLDLQKNIKLKKIEDIPFVQVNSYIFQPWTDVYVRIDYMKAIICLYELEIEKRDSVVFTDFSISENGPAMAKDDLYNPDVLASLQEYGMVLGCDFEERKLSRLRRIVKTLVNSKISGKKVENQFIQALSSPELILSLKHTINFTLNILTTELYRIPEMREKLNNWPPVKLNGYRLSEVLDYKRKKDALDSYGERRRYYEYSFGGILYNAIRTKNFIYLLSLKSWKPIKIRADVVGEGSKNEWVNYRPLEHNYIMFGNALGYFDDMFSYSVNEKDEPWREITRLPLDIEMCNSTPFIVRKIARADLSIGHSGNSHLAIFRKLPELDGNQKKFIGVHWELTQQDTEILNRINSQDDSQSNEFPSHKNSFVSGIPYLEYLTASSYFLWNLSTSVVSDLSTTFADAILGEDLLQ